MGERAVTWLAEPEAHDFLDRPAQIADGYHRVCASYWTDENTDIPCLLAQLG